MNLKDSLSGFLFKPGGSDYYADPSELPRDTIHLWG